MTIFPVSLQNERHKPQIPPKSNCESLEIIDLNPAFDMFDFV